MIRVYVLSNKPNGWIVKVDYGEHGYNQPFKTTFFAVLAARGAAKEAFKTTGQTVSLLIQKKGGRWQEERTYGYDPEDTPG